MLPIVFCFLLLHCLPTCQAQGEAAVDTTVRALDRRSSFVKRYGDKLYLDGKPFYFAGFNAYWLFDPTMIKKNKVDEFMQRAKDAGITAGRCWGFGHQLPERPGVYNEEHFKHVDYVIHSAGQHDVRLQISLGNFWDAYKGTKDYLRWATGSTEGKTVMDFYDSWRAGELYKENIKTWLYRKNTYNGKMYRDDPAIMAWDVMNEPRCPGCDAQQADRHIKWIEDIANFVKWHAPNQLVAGGTEGFFYPDDAVKNTGYNQYNPGAGTQCEGEDWIKTSQIHNIDLAVTHVYERQVENLPPTWHNCRRDFTCIINWGHQYVEAHLKATREGIGKPVVIQETGIRTDLWSMTERKAWMKMMLEHLYNAKKEGRPLMGVLFWNVVLWDVGFHDGYDIFLDSLPGAHNARQFGRKLLNDTVAVMERQPHHGLDTRNASLSTHVAPKSREHPDIHLTDSTDADRMDTPTPNKGAQRRTLLQDFLGPFRREKYREACAAVSSKTWAPAFKLSGVVDFDRLKRETKDLNDVDVLRNGAWSIHD